MSKRASRKSVFAVVAVSILIIAALLLFQSRRRSQRDTRVTESDTRAIEGSADVTAPSGESQAYDQVIEAFGKMKKGMAGSEVTALLGKPASKTDREWFYDFTGLPGFPGLPPAVGSQVFTGAVIYFGADGLVEDARAAWMDATGPAPAR